MTFFINRVLRADDEAAGSIIRFSRILLAYEKTATDRVALHSYVRHLFRARRFTMKMSLAG